MFAVHKATACSTSAFIRAACSRDWKEGRERTIRLPESDHEAFNVYVHCLYSRELDTERMSDSTDTIRKPSYRNLSRLWILGSCPGDQVFMNRVMDRVLEKSGALGNIGVSCETVGFVWSNTAEGCALQHVFTDIVKLASRGLLCESKNLGESVRTLRPCPQRSCKLP